MLTQSKVRTIILPIVDGFLLQQSGGPYRVIRPTFYNQSNYEKASPYQLPSNKENTKPKVLKYILSFRGLCIKTEGLVFPSTA